jgi:hypothetical protein
MADNAFGFYGIRKKESGNAEMARLGAGPSAWHFHAAELNIFNTIT